MATAAILKRMPVRVSITLHSGETLDLAEAWTGESLAERDSELLSDALTPFAPSP